MKPYRYSIILDDESNVRGTLKDMDTPDLPFIKVMEVTYSTYLDFYFRKS